MCQFERWNIKHSKTESHKHIRHTHTANIQSNSLNFICSKVKQQIRCCTCFLHSLLLLMCLNEVQCSFHSFQKEPNIMLLFILKRSRVDCFVWFENCFSFQFIFLSFIFVSFFRLIGEIGRCKSKHCEFDSFQVFFSSMCWLILSEWIETVHRISHFESHSTYLKIGNFPSWHSFVQFTLFARIICSISYIQWTFFIYFCYFGDDVTRELFDF